MNDEVRPFIDTLHRMRDNVHEVSRLKGWWDHTAAYQPIGLVAKLGLIVAEVAEVMETVRVDPSSSEKIAGFTHEEEECADIMLRLLDYCGARGIRIGEATLAKHEFNGGRPHMHGKKI